MATVESGASLRALSTAVALATALLALPASASEIDERLIPTSGTNQADLDLDVEGSFNNPFEDTTTVQPGSAMEVTFDTVTRDLTFNSAVLVGSDVFFDTQGLPLLLQNVEAINILVVQDVNAQNPSTVRIELDGDFMAQVVLPVQFSALVRFNGGALFSFSQDIDILLAGRLLEEGPSGSLALENLTGVIPPLEFSDPDEGIGLTVSGTITLNFAAGLFADGFELGDRSAWSSEEPAQPR